MVTRAVQVVIRFAAVVLLLVMALGVALGGLVLVDRAVMWVAGL